MNAITSFSRAGSQTFSYVVGTVIIGLACAVAFGSINLASFSAWLLDVFGISFISLYGLLVVTSVFCLVRMEHCKGDARKADYWLEAGLHGANGVSTLALTYTLLGISLGIGGLADQELNPQTVQSIISDLTGHFSLAFLTTVVGLPSSAILRALLLLRAKHVGVEAEPETKA
jgi:hypothetical protein